MAKTSNKPTVDHDTLKRHLAYDPDTGDFTWVLARGAAKHGAIAGTNDPRGYVFICLFGRLYTGHRLAWFWMTGSWPDAEIDHINRDPSDNRWANLRPATRSQNALNQRKRKRDLPRGVRRSLDAYQAYRVVGGMYRYLGRFKTPEEARTAYLAAVENEGAIDFARDN